MEENIHTILVGDLEQNGGDPSEMKANGDAPPDGDGGTPPDMPSGEGGSSGGSLSSSVTWSGATEITSGGTYSNQTYSSSTANQNALLINTSENVTLTNPTVRKTGSGESNDNASFYGTNAGVLVKGGSTTSITGGTVTTSADGANGVFSYGGNGGQNGASGDGTTVVISNTTINTTGDGAGGIMTTGGGTTKASNLTITTTGQSSAPIRSDRGGGTVSVSGGSYTSSGLGSPAVYSTAAITVEDATLTSNLSEGVCIEGQNSVVLNDCTLTANNTRTNGNAQFLDAVILYQSMSGDSASGTATFTMNGGTLINKSGHVFHVTNTNAVINLDEVTIEDSGAGVLLSVCDDGWSGASNAATLNASGQTIDGDILVGDDSSLTLNLTGGTTFSGNISGAITNNAGTAISTEVGTVNVSLDSASKWYLEDDVYISSFRGTAANVITNGHTLYVNNSPLSGTTESDDSTPSTVTTALNIANSVNNTLIQGSALNDTIYNSGTRVTIAALGGNDSIVNDVDSSLTAASLGNSIDAGDGDDAIYNYHTYNPTLLGGAGKDSIVVSNGHLTYIDGGDGNDSIVGLNLGIESDDWAMGGHATILGGAGNDYINPIYANNASIDGGAGNDTLVVLGKDATISGGAGNDRITLPDPATLTEGDVEGADDVVIVYNSGDGNDVISGFTADSTLSIGGGLYSSAISGDNVILTVGDGKITLSGAAALDTINIATSGDVEIATSLVGAMLYRTEAGYPVIAGIAFHPEEYHGDEPTNYASKETWTIESADGLELEGFHYTPENSNDKWVVIIHGYGHNHKHMYPFAGFYLANGYNVLMVDQRAAGDSEGTWLTMGTAESEDIALWTQEIARRNSDAKITLFGVSMGAATAMLAAARNDTANVTSLVEDCGYSNVVDIINLFNNLIFQEDQATIDLMMPISESLTGYNLKDAAPINSISSVKVPTLFITGGDDSVVGTYMLSDLYDASGAEVKEKFVVPGAGHGVAGLTDPIGYSNAVFRFVAEADGEGWETENITDNISLRGTSYNDTITNYGTNVTIDALGGDDFLVNDVDSSVTTAGTGNSIVAGDGNDTIYNHHSYRPTLIGGDGNDSIVVSRGHMTYVEGNAGNDTIIGRKVDTITGSDWEIGGYATVLGGDGNDYINTGYSNSASIDGGDGNDTIHATGNRITINGGAGNNLIEVLPSSLDAENACAYIVFSGNTTVQGFKTGWGNGSDTVYIPGDPAGVEFLSGGLTFYNGNDTLALQGVTSTAKVNLYHERRQMLNKGVFIADNEWYSVESSDLSVRSGEEVYFVGPSPSQNYGVDFSGITSNLNLTLDTAYVDSEDYVPGTSIWINSVHSIRGGAGNTTIIGSDLSDTIIAGTGRTTIDGKDGNDRVSLGSAAALVKYTSGDGSDSIYGFNANSTISIGGASYTSATSGDNLILTVGSDKITLFGAADLTSPHIIGTISGGGSDTTISTGINVTNTANNTVLSGTPYNDSLFSWGSNVTIRGLAGNDFIHVYGNSSLEVDAAQRVLIEGGDGNDTMDSGGTNVTMNGGAGNDHIENYAENALANGDAGADWLDNNNSRATLSGGADSDTLINNSGNSSVSLNGGAGNDMLDNLGGTGISMTGGAGNDTIRNSGNSNVFISYTAGDGSDLIRGFNANSTLSIAGGRYSSAKSGNDLILTVGSDKITLFSAANLTNPHIIGTLADGGSSSSTSGGGSSSSTSGGGSSSTTSGGGSSSTTSGGGSSSTTSGGGSSSTTSGGGSSSTTSGGGSSSTTSGGGSSSTTSSNPITNQLMNILMGNRTSTATTTATTEGSYSGSGSFGTSTEDTTGGYSGSGSFTADYVYTGGNETISDYQAGEKIALGTNPTSGSFVDGNLVIGTASGNLVVENAVNKVVDFTDANGNDYIKAYKATNAGTIDGRGLAGFELINGSESNDFIYAGDGGSQLWGSSGTASDLLVGGSGSDVFIAGKNQGADVISNAETKDEVHLNDATLSDIIATAENNGLIAISFNNGNSIAIQSTEALSAAVILSDNSKYRYNHATRNWQSA